MKDRKMKLPLKDTMKAQYGYSVLKVSNCRAILFDGTCAVLEAQMRSIDDYVDEYVNRKNGNVLHMGVFSTVCLNQYIYWFDMMTGDCFFTKVEQAMNIGEHKKLKNSDSIRELWLTKFRVGEYQIWGLYDTDKKREWRLLFSGTLKQARYYSKLWN